MSAEPLIEKWACVGADLNGGKFVHVFRQLNAGGELDPKELLFEKIKGAHTGGIYEAKTTRHTDGRVTLHGGVKWLSQWDNQGDAAEWRARWDAARAADRARKDEAPAKKQEPYREILAPLIRACAKADPIGREVILAKTLRTIMRGQP